MMNFDNLRPQNGPSGTTQSPHRYLYQKPLIKYVHFAYGTNALSRASH